MREQVLEHAITQGEDRVLGRWQQGRGGSAAGSMGRGKQTQTLSPPSVRQKSQGTSTHTHMLLKEARSKDYSLYDSVYMKF